MHAVPKRLWRILLAIYVLCGIGWVLCVSDAGPNTSVPEWTRYGWGNVLDTEFGESGYASAHFGRRRARLVHPVINPVVVPGGYIIGFNVNADPHMWWTYTPGLVRLRHDGTLDTTFGNRGYFLYTAYRRPARIVAMDALGDGRVLVAGHIETAPPLPEGQGLLVFRVTPNGHLDPSFHSNGWAVYMPWGAGNYALQDMATFPDGSILLLFSMYRTGFRAVGILRLQPDGTPDWAFGEGGVREMSFSPSCRFDLEALPSGQFLILSTACGDARLTRFTADGRVDPVFGTDGEVVIPDMHAVQVLPTSDGLLYVGGSVDVQSQRDLVVARFHWNGGIDNTYGVQGRAIFGDPQYDDGFSRMALTRDGRLLVLGTLYVSWYGQFAQVYRLLFNGTVDPQFGDQGRVVDADRCTGGLDVIPGNFGFYLFRLDVCGNDIQHRIPELVALTDTGDLDMSFGEDGVAELHPVAPSDDTLYDVVITPDRRIVAVGLTNGIRREVGGASWTWRLVLARFLPNGVPDISFGETGRVFTGMEMYPAVAAAALSDGSIVVGGGGRFTGAWIVYRLRPDGTPDPAWGVRGAAHIVFPGWDYDSGQLWDMRRLPDDRVVLAGLGYFWGDCAFDCVLRWYPIAVVLRPDGTPDTRFGQGGFFVFRDGDTPAHPVVLPDGRLLLVYQQTDSQNRWIRVVAVRPDGTPDTRFRNGGRFAFRFPGISGLPVFEDVGVLPDGRWVVLVSLLQCPEEYDDTCAATIGMARFLPDGFPDPTFGTDGVVLLPGTYTRYRKRLAISSDGTVWIATVDREREWMLIRVQPDGQPDPSWGDMGGIRIPRLNTEDFLIDWPLPRFLIHQDRPLLATSRRRGADRDFVLVRFYRQAPGLGVTPAVVHFGTHMPADLPVYYPVQVRNVGNVPLWLLSAAVQPEPFALTYDACTGHILEPGDTCTLMIRFYPLQDGSYRGSLDVDAMSDQLLSVSVPLWGARTQSRSLQPVEQFRMVDPECGYGCGVGIAWHNVSEQTFDQIHGQVVPLDPRIRMLDDRTRYLNVLPGEISTDAFYFELVEFPLYRTRTHVDLYFLESLDVSQTHVWTVHVGRSFRDVAYTPQNRSFMRALEFMLHRGIVSGCRTMAFCPQALLHRGQAAIWLARAITMGNLPLQYADPVTGRSYDCTDNMTNHWTDVPDDAILCPAVHYIWARGVTAGCGPTEFCPDRTLNRAQLAVWLSRTALDGQDPPAVYTDPGTSRQYDCTDGETNPLTDVADGDPFYPHVHYLWARGWVEGCRTDPPQFCPLARVHRLQAVFMIARVFGWMSSM